MAIFRPASPFVQYWLAWWDGHCEIQNHAHLRYQCRESCSRACRGAGNLEDPQFRPSGEPMTPEAALWLEWLFRPCTVPRHSAHPRNLCRESREQALRGCVVLEAPED